MPIPIEDYANPTFIRYKERYPLSEDKEDRFNEVFPLHYAGRYQGEDGREGGWKQSGYNPNHQTVAKEKIRVRSENIIIKPY
jgi:hypothetical protein